MKKNYMLPDKQQLIDAIEHVSFEMNRYLYTANPIILPGRYSEIVDESRLLHSRNIGEFFFEEVKSKNDIRIIHYYNELISKDELVMEVDKSKPMWEVYKKRINKKLSHLTFDRINTDPMNTNESSEIPFHYLIELFEKNLPIEFKDKWNIGKSYSM